MNNKDYNEISKLYNSVQKTEFVICKLLNSKTIGKKIFNDYFFEIQTNDKYAHHDLELVKITPDRKRIIISKIEYEYAELQNEWESELPRNIWHGINLMTRKKYGENFDLFIKSSKTYNSLFIIDCRNNFIQNNFSDYIRENNSKRGFITNEEKYEINWSILDKHLFKIKEKPGNQKYKITNNGNICLIENDPNWKLLYLFLYHRFLKKS